MKTIILFVALAGTQLMATAIAHSDRVNLVSNKKTEMKQNSLIVEREVRLNRMARMSREVRELRSNKKILRLSRMGRASREVRFVQMVQLKADAKYIRVSKVIKKNYISKLEK